MNTPSNPFPPLKLLAARSKDAHLTILLTGSTTVYTSSMTNPLSGTRIIHVNVGEKGILEIIMWERSINDLPCRIIMVPELAHMSHDPLLSKNAIEAIKDAISPIHCIWFAARLNETTLNQDEQNVIKWVTTILGEQAWNYAILVLTHANTIKDAWKRADMMKKRSENIRAEISIYTGWDIAANITSVPVTALDDIMLNGKKWLPELYEQIMRRSNLKGITLSANAVSSIEKGHSTEADDQSQEEKKSPEDTLARTLTGCYLSSALVGIVGMSLYGPRGFIIGLAGNLAFWMLLRFLRILQNF
jgi:AIG1 family